MYKVKYGFWFLLIVLFCFSCSLTKGEMSEPTKRPTVTNTIRAPTKTLTPSPTPAACKVTANSLNVRLGPGETYPVTGYLHKDDVVYPTPYPGGEAWIKVKAGEKTGYINSGFTNCKGE